MMALFPVITCTSSTTKQRVCVWFGDSLQRFHFVQFQPPRLHTYFTPVVVFGALYPRHVAIMWRERSVQASGWMGQVRRRWQLMFYAYGLTFGARVFETARLARWSGLPLILFCRLTDQVATTQSCSATFYVRCDAHFQNARTDLFIVHPHWANLSTLNSCGLKQWSERPAQLNSTGTPHVPRHQT